MSPPFSWHRLVAGIAVGGLVSITLSWLLAPELASQLALGHAYQGPSSADAGMLALDVVFSTAASLIGSFCSYRMTRSHPYWSCLGPSLVGSLYYLYETGGPMRMFDTAFPLWYEFAPTNLAAGFLAAFIACRQRSED